MITDLLRLLSYGGGTNQIYSNSESYKDWLEEGIIMNSLAMALVGLGVLLSYAVRRSNLRGPSPDDNDFETDRL